MVRSTDRSGTPIGFGAFGANQFGANLRELPFRAQLGTTDPQNLSRIA